MARAELADKDGKGYRDFVAGKGALLVEETDVPLAADWAPAALGAGAGGARTEL
jgi:hypothetical protein